MDSNDSNFQALEVQIQLRSDDQIDADDIDALTRSLSEELEEVPEVSDVKLALSEEMAPQGSKTGVEVVTLGALLLAILPKAIPALIDFLKEWALRPGSPPVILKFNGIELEYDPRTTSVADIARLIDAVGRLKPKD